MKNRDAEIGFRIKTERHFCGLTQKQLADKLGVSQTAIALWETGARSISVDIAEDLAEILDTSAEYLLFGKSNDDPEADSVPHYYFNDETRQIAQEAFENPELRTLFKVARDIPPERLRAHIEFMKSLKEQERKNDN